MLNALAGPSCLAHTALRAASKTTVAAPSAVSTCAAAAAAARALHTTTTTSASSARHRPWDPTHRSDRGDRSERSPRSYNRPTEPNAERTPRPRPRATNNANSFGMRSTPATPAELEYRAARRQVVDDAARPPPQLQQQATGYAAAVDAVNVNAAPAAPRYRSRRADRGQYGRSKNGRVTVAVDVDADAVAEPPFTPAEAEAEAEGDRVDKRRRWEPTKKLTYAAMAGVRELHAQDPEAWTREALARQFGISYEAVGRILKSKFRARVEDKDADRVEGMGKWASSGAGALGDASPVPIIRKMYAAKRALEAEEAAEAAEGTAVPGRKWAAPVLPGAGADGMSAAERAAAEAAEVLAKARSEQEHERRRALRPSMELPKLQRFVKE